MWWLVFCFLSSCWTSFFLSVKQEHHARDIIRNSIINPSSINPIIYIILFAYNDCWLLSFTVSVYFAKPHSLLHRCIPTFLVSSTLFDAISGGLLFPWHIGVLSGLAYNNALDDSNPLAGSSAGSIAVASHGAGVRPEGKNIYEDVSHII